MYKDLILLVSQGVFNGARNGNGRVCIVDTYLRNYITKHINPKKKGIREHVDMKLESVPCYFNLI